MCKTRVYGLVCLSMVLPTLLFAAALERYKVPYQQSGYSLESKATVNESVYTAFRDKIRGFTDTKKKETREHFRKKLKEAVDRKNLDEASYYRQLIAILNSEL